MISIDNKSDYSPHQKERLNELSAINANIVNLVANDLSNREIHSQVGLSLTALGSRVSTMNRYFGLSDRLQLALFWVRVQRFTMSGLQDRVKFPRYRWLDPKEKRILDALVGNSGRTNQQIYEHLGDMKYGTILDTLFRVNRKVGIGSGASRVGLAVGYELFLSQSNPDRKAL